MQAVQAMQAVQVVQVAGPAAAVAPGNLRQTTAYRRCHLNLPYFYQLVLPGS